MTNTRGSYIISISFLIACLALLSLSTYALADDSECGGCHSALSHGQNIHQALSMGCTSCHGGLDTKKIPHKNTGKNAKGLTSKQSELCYGCHDKNEFVKNNVHGAIMLGCTSCHNPHVSNDPKLLVSAIPELCYSCHEQNSAAMKNSAHSQTVGVACTTCHNPHASDGPLLLTSGFPKTFVQKK